MKDLKKTSLVDLINRINQISVERLNLDLEYNNIIEELYERFPDLKDDPNLEKIKIKEKTSGKRI